MWVLGGNVEYIPSGNVEYGYQVEMLNRYRVKAPHEVPVLLKTAMQKGHYESLG